MTTTPQHGGSRPAVRPDDGRHDNKHGSPGRMPKKFTLELGRRYFVGAHDRDGNAIDNEYAWQVIAIDRVAVTIQNMTTGTTYRVRR